MICHQIQDSLLQALMNCVFLEDCWIDLGELFEKYVFLNNSVIGAEE